MEFSLTKRETETLLELLHLGETVANAPKHAKDVSAEHRALASKLFEFAEEHGLGFLAAYDEAREGYAASEALKARLDVAGYQHDYDDWVFWDELALRLAERDLIEEIGRLAFDRMPEAERRERTEALAASYDAEFDRNGADRLRLPAIAKRARRRDTLTEKLKKLFDDKS